MHPALPTLCKRIAVLGALQVEIDGLRECGGHHHTIQFRVQKLTRSVFALWSPPRRMGVADAIHNARRKNI